MRVQTRMVTTLRRLSFGLNLSDLLIPRKDLYYKDKLASQLTKGMHCLQHPAFKLKNKRSFIINTCEIHRRLIIHQHHKRCVSCPKNNRCLFQLC